MTDLAAKIAQLEALRATLTGDAARALDDAIRALRAEQALQQRMEASDGGVLVNPSQTIVQGDQHIHQAPQDPALQRRERALLTYLQRTRGECNALPLGQIDQADAAHARPLELEQVYISLHTTTQIEVTEEENRRWADGSANPMTDERQTRPLTAVEALARAEHGRLMLLGAPGGGKSTFVSHLALCLAGAALCERHPDEPQPQDGWLARLPGWTRGALLPMRVVLRDFAAFEPLATSARGSARLLRDFLGHTLTDAGCAEALEPLAEALERGQAVLLLDGLDEVVGESALRRVGESIADAMLTYARSPMLITCRILDYQAEPLRQLPGFATQTLADLTNEQIDGFIAGWYAELAASGRRTATQAADDIRALQQAVEARDELRDLARLPLLLTVMALVHAHRGALPDARALLYKECIELLLLRWRQPHGEVDLLARLGLNQFRGSDLLALMAQLGFAAHEAAERTATDQTRPADLSEAQVIGILADGFAQYDTTRRYALAQEVLEALAQRNGLLLKRGPGTYAFPHRTFQEFLAGYHLKGQRDYRKLCLERAPQAHWHEALALMVGYQVLADRELEKPLDLAEKLLSRTPTELALAGELLNLIGRARAASYDPALVAPGGLWPRAQAVLHTLATTGKAPEAPAALRVRAGLALGTLCYGSVDALCGPGATIPLPDRRLPLAVLGLPAQGQEWWRPALEAYWCSIEAGPFWHGDDLEKQPLQQVELPHNYNIGRYPVTNADYARFVAAGGYTQQQWWTDEGWKWRLPGGHPYSWEDNEQPITEPWLWRDTRYNQPTQPVVGISWYEATAYCNWLSAQGHTQGWLPPEETIRLPTWLEWERAARHTDQRRYPWGDVKPDIERANYQETGIDRPSPVGCFPAGAAACGAMDMVGTICEWTASLDSAPTKVSPEKDITTSQVVLFAYNDFSDETEQLCCGARDWYVPSTGTTTMDFGFSGPMRSSFKASGC